MNKKRLISVLLAIVIALLPLATFAIGSTNVTTFANNVSWDSGGDNIGSVGVFNATTNTTYIPYYGINESIYIISYNGTTNTWSTPVKIADSLLPVGDAHGQPSIAQDSAGYLYVFGNSHGTDVQFYRSILPNSITSWATIYLAHNLVGNNMTTAVPANGTAEYFDLTQFTANETGTVTAFKVRSMATGNVKIAIYSDNGSDYPGALLTGMNIGQTVVPGWNTLNITATNIVSGTKYWLGASTDTNGAYGYVINPATLGRYKKLSDLASNYNSFTFPNPVPVGYSNGDTLEYVMSGWTFDFSGTYTNPVISATDNISLFYRAANPAFALSYNGTTDYLLAGGLADWQSADHTGTVEVWFKTDNTSTGTLWNSADTLTNNHRLEFYVSGNRLYSTQTDDGVTLNTIIGSPDVTTGIWHMATLSSNGTSYTMTLDGVTEALIVGAGANNGNWLADTSARDDISIGAMRSSVLNNYFDGSIGAVRYYSTVLDLATIQSDYNLGRNVGSSTATGLIFNLPCSEGTGNPVDTVGAVTMTRTGNPTWYVDGTMSGANPEVVLTSNDGGANWTSPQPIIASALQSTNQEEIVYTGGNFRIQGNYIPISWAYRIHDSALPILYDGFFAAYYNIATGHMYSQAGVDLGVSIIRAEAQANCRVVTIANNHSMESRARMDTSNNTHIIYLAGDGGTNNFTYQKWTGAAWSAVQLTGAQAPQSNRSCDFEIISSSYIVGYFDTGDIKKYSLISGNWTFINTIASAATYGNVWHPSIVSNYDTAVKLIFGQLTAGNVNSWFAWGYKEYMQTNPATNILYSGARLNSKVLSTGNDTSVSVKFGIGTTSLVAEDFDVYDNTTSWVSGYHINSLPYLDKTGLTGNMTYYYRAESMDSYGVIYASTNEISFTTSSAVGNASNMIGYPSDTSITLTWTKASGSTRTIIRYRTDTYPVNTSDGYSAYNGTGYQTIVTGLIPGTTYYFSAWGTGSPDSLLPSLLPMSTTPTPPPSGSSSTPDSVLPSLTIPANANQPPALTGGGSGSFNLEPFTGIINYFVTAPGGLGMPVENAWQGLATIGIVIAGIGTYIKIKNFFIAFFVVFVLSIVGVGLHLVQGYLVAFEIIVGMGVWAIEKYLQ